MADDTEQRRTRAEIANLESLLPDAERKYNNAKQGSPEQRAAKDNLDGIKNQIANKKSYLRF